LKHLAPSGNILFTVIRSKGVAIAYHFGFIFNKTLTWYKPSFDPDFLKHSPGEVLIKELLEYASYKDLDIFDFTVGKESFKLRFANEYKMNHSFKILKTQPDYWKSVAKTSLQKIFA
jgi:CelD/BcsL family acetyltransferase involved in cellulose biosynthesis